MRILHTSDWHLGQSFYGKSRAKEHQQFLAWLLAQVTQFNIDVVIVAGDIFDTSAPPSYAREIYFDFIHNITRVNCQLVILAGNHDSVAMLGESKQILASLSVHVIPAVSENIAEQVFTLFDHENVAQAVICAIPFIRPRDVLKSTAGQSAKDKQLSLQQAIAQHYHHLYQQALELAQQGEKKLPIIATGHLTTVGVSTTDAVRDIYIGTLDAFPASEFPNANYIALGHIHQSQKVAKTEHIRYCGSPIPLSFDELKKDKQVLLVEFDEKNKAVVKEITVPKFHPMAMIKTDLDSLEEHIKAVVAEQKLLSELTNKDDKIWLDIEIDSAQYLQDLSFRIEQITKDLPVEVLLVRRSKVSRATMPAQQKKITLEELSLEDVFDARLSQENWQTPNELARKNRIVQLFQQTVADLESSDENSNKESLNANYDEIIKESALNIQPEIHSEKPLPNETEEEGEV